MLHLITNLARHKPSSLVILLADLHTKAKFKMAGTVRFTRRAFEACGLVAKSVSKADRGCLRMSPDR